MKNIFFLFIGTVFLIQCTPKPLDLTLPDFEPKTTVASQILPGEIMFIGLTKSFTVLSDEGSNSDNRDADFFDKILVDSALVTINHSGITDTLFKVSNGLFASIKTLDNPGTIYTLNVIDYDLGEVVSSTTEMLQKISFDTVYPVITKNPTDTTVFIQTEFTDSPSEENYYMINVYTREVLDAGLDLNSFFENGQNKVQVTRIYSDQELNPGKNEIEISLKNIAITDSVAVTLSNISEEYYSFLKKRERAGNIFSDITAEPINYPSNIKNGLGFFNTHYPDVHYFDLKEF